MWTSNHSSSWLCKNKMPCFSMNNWGRTSQETQHNCNNYHSSLLLELHLIEAWKVIDKHWTKKQGDLFLLDKKNVFSWTHKICFSISSSPKVVCFDDWSMIDHALLTQNTFLHQSSFHAVWTDIEKITNCTPDKLKGYCRDALLFWKSKAWWFERNADQ
jgi:hypothetical protein